MTPEEFVSCIRNEVLDGNLRTYVDLLNNTPAEGAADEYWQELLQAYSSMNERQRSALRLMARQVMIDTISNLFGVLDGTSPLEDHRESFVLTYGAANEKLNGDLQDYFLAAEEEPL